MQEAGGRKRFQVFKGEMSNDIWKIFDSAFLISHFSFAIEKQGTSSLPTASCIPLLHRSCIAPAPASCRLPPSIAWFTC